MIMQYTFVENLPHIIRVSLVNKMIFSLSVYFNLQTISIKHYVSSKFSFVTYIARIANIPITASHHSENLIASGWGIISLNAGLFSLNRFDASSDILKNKKI